MARTAVLQRGISFEMKLPAYEEPVAYGSLTKEQFDAEIEKYFSDLFWLLLYTSLYISYTKFPFHFCFNFIC